MLRAAYTLAIIMITSVQSFAKVCDPKSEFARFECAEAGDNFANIGDFTSARQSWAVACDKGDSASCKSSTEYSSNPSAFKDRWSADPSNAKAADQSKRDFLTEQCQSGVAKTKDCVANAKKSLKEGDRSAAILMLEAACDKEDSAGCFELGEVYVRAQSYELAVKPYMSACSLGNEKACPMLQQVQAKIANDLREEDSAKNDRKIANEKATRDDEAR